MNYAQDHHAHVRTEFPFDVNEASKRHLAPSAYLRHAGLRSLLPRVAYAGVVLQKDDFPSETGHARRKSLPDPTGPDGIRDRLESIPEKPGIQTHLLAALIAILPKVGKTFGAIDSRTRGFDPGALH